MCATRCRYAVLADPPLLALTSVSVFRRPAPRSAASPGRPPLCRASALAGRIGASGHDLVRGCTDDSPAAEQGRETPRRGHHCVDVVVPRDEPRASLKPALREAGALGSGA
jgi:hypothetical protein